MCISDWSSDVCSSDLLNFFQHHCYITARVPRTDCPEHGVKRVRVPWAREGSGFTLLFEQAALMLAREMPVLAAAREMGITDQRLWRIIGHYVGAALERLDLADLKRSEEHTSELQSLMRISYAVFCL